LTSLPDFVVLPGRHQFLTPDEIKGLHLDNPDAYMQRIYFWQDVPPPPEVQRNLERGQSRSVSSAAANPQQRLSAALEALLELRGVAKRFGAREVLKNISLNIASGEFLTLLGESGSGKTTVLRLVAGFERPSAGEIWMSGQRLTPFHLTNAA